MMMIGVDIKLTGVILAGGKSSRMGTNKALLTYEGKPFIEHVISAAREITDDVLIISDHRELSDFRALRLPDLYIDKGPIAGIYSGMKFSGTTKIMALSCDIPKVSPNLLKRLTEEHQKNDADVTEFRINGKDYPLAAIYEKRCMSRFQLALELDELRLQEVLKDLKVCKIELTGNEAHFLDNINTPEQFKELIHAN